jgi:hypothetical protein
VRRTPTSLIEASMDLGADGGKRFGTSRSPASSRRSWRGDCWRSPCVRRDHRHELHLGDGNHPPQWMYNNLRLPNQRPQVNIVALVVIVLSLIPVYIAQRLTEERPRSGVSWEHARFGSAPQPGPASARRSAHGTIPCTFYPARRVPSYKEAFSAHNLPGLRVCCDVAAEARRHTEASGATGRRRGSQPPGSSCPSSASRMRLRWSPPP